MARWVGDDKKVILHSTGEETKDWNKEEEPESEEDQEAEAFHPDEVYTMNDEDWMR